MRVFELAISLIMQNPTGTRRAAEIQNECEKEKATSARPIPPAHRATKVPSPLTDLRCASTTAPRRAPTPEAAHQESELARAPAEDLAREDRHEHHVGHAGEAHEAEEKQECPHRPGARDVGEALAHARPDRCRARGGGGGRDRIATRLARTAK